MASLELCFLGGCVPWVSMKLRTAFTVMVGAGKCLVGTAEPRRWVRAVGSASSTARSASWLLERASSSGVWPQLQAQTRAGGEEERTK